MENLTQKITFLNLFAPGWMMVTLLLTGVLIFFAFYKFSIPSRKRFRITLAALRSALLFVLFLIILDPHWNTEDSQKWAGLLIDRSQSMSIKDGGETETRQALGAALFQAVPAWQKLLKERVKKIYTFDTEVKELETLGELTPPDGKESRLLSAVREIDHLYQKDENLLGWILLSDGAATDLEEGNFSVFDDLSFPWITVKTGTEEKVPNFKFKKMDLKQEVFVNEVIPIEITWEQSGFDGQEGGLSVFLDGEEVFSGNIPLAEGKFTVDLKIQSEGRLSVEAAVTPLEGEGAAIDNRASTWLLSKPRKIRVFYSESFYKDENLFKKALLQDPEFEVDFASSLIGFAKEKSQPYIKDPLHGLPQSREELLQYDVIVLSDVKKTLLSEEQISAIRELVESGGGAFIMIGGIDSFGDGGYQGTDVEKMLPVDISEEYGKDVVVQAKGTVEGSFRPLLTAAALDHPIMKLSEDPETNVRLWKEMPLLGGYNYVGRLKPGATVLLEHPEEKSTFGSRIILAVQPFGRGKVMAFTSDVTHNWGEWFQSWKDEDDQWIFGKFWRQTLKWLTENRLQEKLSPVALELDPAMPQEDQPLKVQIHLPRSEFITPQTVQLSLEAISKEQAGREIITKEFKNVQDKKMNYRIESLPAGDYVLHAKLLRDALSPIEASKPFHVHVSRKEADHLEVNAQTLNELAARSRGAALSMEHPEAMEEAFAQLYKNNLRQRVNPFWTQPWIYLLILGLLFLDWFLRKQRGLE